MTQEGKQKVLVFSVDGSKKEVKLTVPSGDVGKLKQKNLDINGPIDVKAEGCAIKGTVSKHQLQGKGKEVGEFLLCRVNMNCFIYNCCIISIQQVQVGVALDTSTSVLGEKAF